MIRHEVEGAGSTSLYFERVFNMSKEYDAYIRMHKSCVVLGYLWLSMNVYDEVVEVLPDLITFSRASLSQQMLSHDQSKYDYTEYQAYNDYFYGNKDLLNKDQVEIDFNKAWLHHIHKNPHHWQHWVLMEDDCGLRQGLDIPDNYILEMICDWWAFSWKKFIDGKMQNVSDLKEIFDWYDNHKDIMVLNKTIREKVESILDIIKGQLAY